MDPLERIRSHIPGFAGYDTAQARRLSDEQIRAYAGERLAALRDGNGVPAGTRDSLESLLMRAEFANQRAFHGFDEIPTAEQIAAVAQVDADLLDAADTGDFGAIERAFDGRDAAMRHG